MSVEEDYLGTSIQEVRQLRYAVKRLQHRNLLLIVALKNLSSVQRQLSAVLGGNQHPALIRALELIGKLSVGDV